MAAARTDVANAVGVRSDRSDEGGLYIVGCGGSCLQYSRESRLANVSPCLAEIKAVSARRSLSAV